MIKVYRYGLLAPVENSILVRQQIKAGHDYKNRLCAIEIERRNAQRALNSSYGTVADLEPSIATTEAKIVELLAEVKRKKKLKLPVADEQEMITSLKAGNKAAKELRHSALSGLHSDPEKIAKSDLIEEQNVVAHKMARAASGLWRCNYDMHDAAHADRRKMPLYVNTLPNNPEFKRWRNEGAVGIRFKTAPDVEAVEKSRYLQIEPMPLPPRADPNSKLSQKRRYCLLKLRIGSAPENQQIPVWAAWPMVMHRPLPPDAVVKSAAVHLRMIGPREEWSVVITVEFPEPVCLVPADAPRVAIDVGWRILDDGILVATCVDDHGGQEKLVLPPKLLSKFQKTEELRSIRATSFNEILSVLLKHRELVELPTWFPKSLAHWTSANRLQGMIQHWKDNRFDGDDEFFAIAEAWRHNDEHLWRWEADEAKSAQRFRREIYRCFASRMSKKYSRVVMEHFVMTKIVMRPEPGEKNNPIARSNRHKSSISELRDALTQAFYNRKDEVPAANTTATCNWCKSIQVWDQAEHVVHRCTSCNAVWDQDFNACRNLLDHAPVVVEKVAKEKKWERVKRLKAEKEARAEQAPSL